MKNLKKLVSVIVTVAMLISSFAALSVSANGNYADVETDSSYYKAIKVLSGLGIVKGDDQGNFNPKSDIKRSEMVALVCRAVGEEAVAQSSGGASFDDVAADHWAAGYIAWGVAGNIVKGVGDNKFDPDASVKFQDAVVMVLRALGYERIANRAENGGYPTGYLKLASQKGVLAGASFDANTAATREVVAQVIYNAMTTPIVDISYFGAKPEDDEYTVYDGKNNTELRTLLSYTCEIYKVKATVNATAKSDDTLVDNGDGEKVELIFTSAFDQLWSEILDGSYKKDDVETVFVGETEVADYLGYSVEAYLTENEDEEWVLLAVVPDSKMATQKIVNEAGNFVKYDPAEGIFEYYEDINDSRTKDIDVADDAMVYYNGKAYKTLDKMSAADIEKMLVKDANTIEFMGPKHGDATMLFVTDYVYFQVEDVQAADSFVKFTNGNGLSLDVDDRNNDKFIYNIYDAEGNAIALEDVKEDDIFNIVAPMIAASYDKHDAMDALDEEVPYMDIYVTDTAVEGSVREEVIAGKKYKINDTEYAVDNNASIKVGDEGIFYITIDGKVYDSDAASVVNKNYSFITAYGADISFGVNTHQIKLFTAEGTLETYDVANTLKVYEGDKDPVTYRKTGSNKLQDEFFATNATFKALTKPADKAAGYASREAAEADLANRIVTYKTNASNEITELRFAAKGADFGVDTVKAEYIADTQAFGQFDVNDSSKLFVAPVSEVGTGVWNVDEDDLEIASFSALEEDEFYEVSMYQFDRDDYLGAALVKVEISGGLKKSHLAVVKSVSTGLDADDVPVTVYTFVQGGEVKTLAVDDDKAGTEADDTFTVGDVFRYSVNGESEIVKTELIYDYSAKEFKDLYKVADHDKNDIAIVYGKVSKIKDGKMTLVDDSDVVTDSYRLGSNEGNTYALIDEERIDSGVNTSAGVKALAGSANIKASYGSNAYYVVAIVGETSRFEDIVQIDK